VLCSSPPPVAYDGEHPDRSLEGEVANLVDCQLGSVAGVSKGGEERGGEGEEEELSAV